MQELIATAALRDVPPIEHDLGRTRARVRARVRVRVRVRARVRVGVNVRGYIIEMEPDKYPSVEKQNRYKPMYTHNKIDMH